MRKPTQRYRFAFVVVPSRGIGPYSYTQCFFNVEATSPEMAVRKFSGAKRRKVIPRRSLIEHLYRLDPDGVTVIDLNLLVQGAMKIEAKEASK
jgi:hypothetical protein